MMIPHPYFFKKNTLFKKKSPLPLIVTIGFFFLVASCSTKGPGTRSYPDRTGEYKDSKNHNFNYRQDRLKKQDKETEKSLKKSEPFSEPEKLVALKGFTDDLSRASLEKAITNQLQAMIEQEPSTPVRLGAFTLTRARLVETLKAFLEVLSQGLPIEKFNKKISEEFVLYRVGKGKNKKVLFTGYYRPVIEASLKRTSLYRYPIYQMPEQGLQRVKYRSGIQLIGTNTGIKKIRESYAEKKA